MKRTHAFLSPLLLGLLIVIGCDQSGLNSGAPSASPKTTVTSLLYPAAIIQDTETLTGFVTPESALYDPVADVYYVSNVGQLFVADGFISRIDPAATGDVSGDPGYVWISGLNDPFGITLDENTLYVVDRDGLYVYDIDRATGDAAQVDFIALGMTGSLLNDVCIGHGGTIYVTDTGLDLATSTGTGTDALYQIQDGTVSVFVEDEAEEGPNGCFTNGANVFWTTFKSNTVYRTNPSGRKKTVAMLPTGGIDSLVRSGGTLYASSWNADPADPNNPTGAIYSMSLGGTPIETALSPVFTPGDLGYDTLRDRLLVPSVFGNEVIVATVP
ncbi:MAG TPA: hypothetical protein VKP65_15165 [Rhodothermales bacterium]|nr:hypothetical protein [Rhodothermales bacterium]